MMSGGCTDLRKTWKHLVGKSQDEAVKAIQKDGEQNIEVVADDSPDSDKPIKSGFVRIIVDQTGYVKYAPLRQN